MWLLISDSYARDAPGWPGLISYISGRAFSGRDQAWEQAQAHVNEYAQVPTKALAQEHSWIHAHMQMSLRAPVQVPVKGEA